MNTYTPNAYRQNLIGAAIAFGMLAAGTPGLKPSAHAADLAPVTSAAGPSAQAEKAQAEGYDEDARTLEVKASEHARLADHYRGRASGGSKQGTTFWTLANHHEQLAKADRDAALIARNNAQMHRKLAGAP